MQYRVCVEKQVLEVTIMGCTLLPKWGGGGGWNFRKRSDREGQNILILEGVCTMGRVLESEGVREFRGKNEVNQQY